MSNNKIIVGLICLVVSLWLFNSLYQQRSQKKEEANEEWQKIAPFAAKIQW
jgi:hypothetical protein